MDVTQSEELLWQKGWYQSKSTCANYCRTRYVCKPILSFVFEGVSDETDNHVQMHTQYERPLGLWIGVGDGLVRHHSYQTLVFPWELESETARKSWKEDLGWCHIAPKMSLYGTISRYIDGGLKCVVFNEPRGYKYYYLPAVERKEETNLSYLPRRCPGWYL